MAESLSMASCQDFMDKMKQIGQPVDVLEINTPVFMPLVQLPSDASNKVGWRAAPRHASKKLCKDNFAMMEFRCTLRQ